MQNTSRCSVADMKRGNSSFDIPKLQPSKSYILHFELKDDAAISFSEFYLY